MTKQIITLLLVFYSCTIFSQNKLKLVRGNKVAFIDSKDDAYFYQTMRSSNGDSIDLNYNGKLQTVNSDSIKIIPEELNQHIYFTDKRKWELHTFYNADTISRISLHKKDIDIILVSRPFANFLIVAGVTAAFSALIVAPLASLNYKTGVFNQNRYGLIAGTSAALFFPCIIVGIKFNYKEYYLKHGKNTWSIAN